MKNEAIQQLKQSNTSQQQQYSHYGIRYRAERMSSYESIALH